ncbi:MAG: nucleotide exchange factor GrpE [Candidatus Zambryskibacteria bacterium]|nr:nucleotide exchange factor GrpE [Candidatus Zambryskibacteria bacterium]
MNDDQLKKDLEETLESASSADSSADEAEEFEDIVFEENTEVTGADFQKKYSALKGKVKELEAKASEYLNGWQKDKADFINLRKKDEEAKKQVTAFAKEDLINELIPVLDSFESAMKNKEAWAKVDANWRVGVEYIASQLNQTLENNGLKKVYPIGQPFDHTRDEALEMVPTEDKSQDGVVLDVVQTGYMFGDRLVRPPKVKVGEYKKD